MLSIQQNNLGKWADLHSLTYSDRKWTPYIIGHFFYRCTFRPFGPDQTRPSPAFTVPCLARPNVSAGCVRPAHGAALAAQIQAHKPISCQNNPIRHDDFVVLGLVEACALDEAAAPTGRRARAPCSPTDVPANVGRRAC